MEPFRTAWTAYSKFLQRVFGLTLGGRIAFTLTALLGWLGILLNAQSNEPGADSAGAVYGALVVLVLAAVIGADGAFRGLRYLARRIACYLPEPGSKR